MDYPFQLRVSTGMFEVISTLQCSKIGGARPLHASKSKMIENRVSQKLQMDRSRAKWVNEN